MYYHARIYNVECNFCYHKCIHSHCIARIHPVQSTPDPQCKQSRLGLPLPLLTQVQIHSQPKSNRWKYLTTIRDDDTPSPEHRSNGCGQTRPSRKKRKHQHKVGGFTKRGYTVDLADRKLPGPPELSTEEKLEISVTIEKKK